MKVLIINVNYMSGSTGWMVYELYSKLSKKGINCAVAYGRGNAIDEPGISRVSNDLEVGIHALLTRLTGWTGCFSPMATAKLLNFIEKFKPDIIHLHVLHGYYLNIHSVIEYIKRKNIKTIWTFHCEFMYTGRCGISLSCDKWKKGCGKCSYLGEYPSTLIFDFSKGMYERKRKLFEGFDNLTIVTPSKWLEDRVRKSFLKDKSIITISNGVDTRKFFPRSFDNLKQRHGITDERIVLSVACNIMSEFKGGRHVVELAQEMSDYNIRFILIGVENPTQTFGDNVIALDRINNQMELARYYSMADVFLMCSRKETFSLTCAEALCCGCRVVGFESGAPNTIFSPPYAHFVKQGCRNALKSRLLKDLDSGLSREETARYGKNEFDIDKMFEKYFALYIK